MRQTGTGLIQVKPPIDQLFEASSSDCILIKKGVGDEWIR